MFGVVEVTTAFVLMLGLLLIGMPIAAVMVLIGMTAACSPSAGR